MSRHERHSPHSGVTRRNALQGAAVLSGGVALLGGAATLGASPAFASNSTLQSEPDTFTRADWGAQDTGPPEVIDTPPAYIVVHHTATENQSDTSQEAAFALSRGIQQAHISNGWGDAGQQLTISRGGHIMEGRAQSLEAIRNGQHVIGAHAANHNSEAVGIENEGTYIDQAPTDALWNSLVETVAWLVAQYEVSPDNIVGHRDLVATECPGDHLYGMLDDLRNDVSALVAEMGVDVSALRSTPLPPAPAVPENEPKREFYHGPAVGG